MKQIVKNLQSKLLSDNWGRLKKITYEYLKADDTWETQTREVYDRGNGATILLFHPKKKTVLLTRQFRIPTYLNGNAGGMMIEACAGVLEDEPPEDCVKREALEETGYQIPKVEKVFECYMSPGSVTEIIHFFIAEYDESMKQHSGGGVSHEQENIEVIEMHFEQALQMIQSGEIKDAKTIMLLQYLNGRW